jgi:exopolysaccharide production protein ExoZ
VTARADTLLNIQALRGLAALSVVVFHASARAGDALAAASAGVDVFFVISGFIIWTIGQRAQSALSFAADRIVRIAPIYWIAIALLAARIALDPSVQLFAPHMVASFAFIAYLSPTEAAYWPLLPQGWTLNYEMFFYALFAAALWLPSALRLPALAGALIGLVAFGRAIGAGVSFIGFYTDPILLEFVAGLALGGAYVRGWTPGPRLSALLIAAGVLALAAQAFVPIAAARVLEWGAPAACIVAGAIGFERANIRLTMPALRLMGDASYSIYLFHTFAIAIVARLVGDRLGILPETLASTMAGLAAFLLVERPLLAAIRGWRAR